MVKKVKDFMNKNVICFSPEDSIFKVVETFSKKQISGAPVVENGNLVGIISSSDITKTLNLEILSKAPLIIPCVEHLFFHLVSLTKEMKMVRERLKILRAEKVKEIMNKKPKTISPEDSIYDAAKLMNKHDINRLPVVKNNKLVGIITRQDIINSLIRG